MSINPFIDTPLDVLLVIFQEDRYWWAVGNENPDFVDCRFCKARAEGLRPENVNHKEGCVVDLASKMIMNNEAFLQKVRGRPKRQVYKGRAELTVYRPGQWKDAMHLVRKK